MNMKKLGVVLLSSILLVSSSSIVGVALPVNAIDSSVSALSINNIYTFDITKISMNGITINNSAVDILNSNIPVNTNIYLKAFYLRKDGKEIISHNSSYKCTVIAYKLSDVGERTGEKFTYNCSGSPCLKFSQIGSYEVVFKFTIGSSIYKYRTIITCSDSSVLKSTNGVDLLNNLSVQDILGNDKNVYENYCTSKVVSVDGEQLNTTKGIIPKGVFTIGLTDYSNRLSFIKEFGKVTSIKVYRLNVKSSSVSESNFTEIYSKTYSTPTCNPLIQLDTRGGDCAFKVEFTTVDGQIYKTFTPTYKMSKTLPLYIDDGVENVGTTVHPVVKEASNKKKVFSKPPQTNGSFISGDVESVKEFLRYRLGTYGTTLEYKTMSDYTNHTSVTWRTFNDATWRSFTSSASSKLVLRITDKSTNGRYRHNIMYIENIGIADITNSINIYNCFVSAYGASYVNSYYGVKFEKLSEALELNNTNDYLIVSRYLDDISYINKGYQEGTIDNFGYAMSTNIRNPYDLSKLLDAQIPVSFDYEKFNEDDIVVNGLHVSEKALSKYVYVNVWVFMNNEFVKVKSLRKDTNTDKIITQSNDVQIPHGIYTVRVTTLIGEKSHVTDIDNCPIVDINM